MTEPILDLTLQPGTSHIVVRAENISRGEWYRIALLLADQTPPVDEPMPIRAERLLRDRLVLQGLLGDMSIGIRADEGVTALLGRSRDDQRALSQALRGEPRPQPRVDPADDHRRVIRELQPFQQRDLHRLIDLHHGANFSVPGAGKTTVSYALHAHERAAGRVTKLLVIAPLSAFGAWEEDAIAVLEPAPHVARWRGGPVPDADVILMNYDRLPGNIEPIVDLLTRHPTHLVLDEAHRAKRGAVGEWGRTILAIAPFAARRDVLTGTPAPNHPKDLASLLDILWPGGAARAMLPRAALSTEPPETAMRHMNTVISPLYVRTTKNELGLRDPLITLSVVPMGELQQQIYDAMLNRYAGALNLDRRDAAAFAQMGEVTMYLLQAASSPRLLSRNAIGARAYRYPSLAIAAGSRLARLVDDYADHEVPAKVAQACRIVYANAQRNRKTLVWSNFPGNLLDLEQQLAALNPALVYGAIPANPDADAGVRTRERELARFRHDDDCLVLLANPAAMSEGVSLHHHCNDAVYLDRTFNAGQYLQSLDRIHRLGLDPGIDTRITLLTSSGTIDERVNIRVEEKARRMSLMLDDPFLAQMALPDDDDTGDVLDDVLDLQEVLSHLADGMTRNPPE